MAVSLFLLLSSLAAAKKQPAQQAVVSWYEGPVRDWYGGSCPYHPDVRHHFPIGIHGCWRNLVILKAGDQYLTMEDHCATPWKFEQGETVEFQRDAKYHRKIYVNRHVFALTRESDTPDEAERSTPAVRDNPAPSNSRKTSSGSTLGLVGADWEEGGVRGVQISDVSEGGSAALAGLHKGDVIVEVNGQKVASAQDLSSLTGQMEPGGKVSIAYFVRTNLGWMPKETSAILAKRD